MQGHRYNYLNDKQTGCTESDLHNYKFTNDLSVSAQNHLCPVFVLICMHAAVKGNISHTVFLFAYKAMGFFFFWVFDIWAFQKCLFYLHENTWQEKRKISLSLAQLSKGTQETGSQLQNSTPAAWSRWGFNVFLKGTSSGKILVIMRAFSSHSVVSQ